MISERIKDPKMILEKLRKEKDEISELISQGDVGKADEIKKNIAWKKAFDKTEGKKVQSSHLFHFDFKINIFSNLFIRLGER